MSKTIAFTTLALSLASTLALAAPKNYSCGNVGGTEEWNVSIDLAKKQASFFDNDSVTTVPLKKTMVLESYPPQYVYIFEGEDTGGAEGSKLVIRFNETRLTASVTLDAGTPDAETFEALDGCKAE